MAKQSKSKAELRAELATLVAAYAGPVQRNAPEPTNEQENVKRRRPWWQKRQAPNKILAT